MMSGKTVRIWLHIMKCKIWDQTFKSLRYIYVEVYHFAWRGVSLKHYKQWLRMFKYILSVVKFDSALLCGQTNNISCSHDDNYLVNKIINLTSDNLNVCQFLLLAYFILPTQPHLYPWRKYMVSKKYH